MEDKIRSLCAQILTEQDDDEVFSLLAELRDALHERIQRLRVELAGYPVVNERRNNSVEAGLYLVDGGGPVSVKIRCAACNQPLTLLSPSTCADENGRPFHEDCYVKQIPPSAA
ncbi:MAG: hypothetical protein WCA13_12480 [Terriglobales bacterium]